MDIDALLVEATSARLRAYAPYSKFQVGAALLCESGKVFRGCNIENVSFGLTLCAERVCAGAAIAAGETNFQVVVVVADSADPVVPCGACRQFLAEFNPNLKVYGATLGGKIAKFDLSELLPRSAQGILEHSA